MLKTRVLSALILIPIVIAIVLYLPFQYFTIISAVVFLLGAFEWTALAGYKKRTSRAFAFILMPVLAFCMLSILNLIPWMFLNYLLLLIVAGFWLWATYLVFNFNQFKSLYHKRFVCLLMGILVLFPAFASLLMLQKLSPTWVLYLLVLIWAQDTGAYFVGKWIGRHKLAPEVSPGKTWEGVFGGLALSLVVAVLAYFLLRPEIPHFYWLLIATFTVLFSIVGDLLESTFKRAQGLKDSGFLIPGHGGVLDRLDSLFAALPIFVLGLCSFTTLCGKDAFA